MCLLCGELLTKRYPTPRQEPTLQEEDLVELGVHIRLHRRRLLALIASFIHHGMPPEALMTAGPVRPATANEPSGGATCPTESMKHDPAPADSGQPADSIQQELWAAARLELLALEEEQQGGPDTSGLAGEGARSGSAVEPGSVRDVVG